MWPQEIQILVSVVADWCLGVSAVYVGPIGPRLRGESLGAYDALGPVQFIVYTLYACILYVVFHSCCPTTQPYPLRAHSLEEGGGAWAGKCAS